MTDKRKYMRVTLPADDVAAFDAEKIKAQDAAKTVWTDPQFATNLIRWALQDRNTAGRWT